MLHQMARGEGIGAIAGQGIRRMKDYFVTHFGVDRAFLDDVGMEAKGKAYRQSQYEQLCDAVYRRRGWDDDGVPTLAKLHELGIDFPELVEVVNQHDSRRSPVGVR